MPPTLPRFVVIFVVSRSVFFFPKNEKPNCTIGVDVLGSVETQLDFREKKILC
jgi:hypothetical protein